MKIKNSAREEIQKAIDDLFLNLKARLLGRFFTGPRIYFEVVHRANPMETLEGLYRFTIATLYGPSAKVDEDHLEALANTAGNFIEAERLKASNHIMADLSGATTAKEVKEIIDAQIDKSTEYINGLVANEARTVQSYAEREGIMQLAASIGVEDPLVAKLGIIDKKLCPICVELWHTDDNIQVPRVYRLSELKEGYMKDHKNPYPTVGPTHPHCRHIMTFIPPNYGFKKDGTITFKGFGHDEYATQRKK
ncbi:MAG: hypothetical protein ACREGB_01810 [Candidatus Saccharimonadales bacterium]